MEERKKILEVRAKDWSPEGKEKLGKFIRSKNYKYKVVYETVDGQTKYGYTNDPVTSELYIKAENGRIIKTVELKGGL